MSKLRFFLALIAFFAISSARAQRLVPGTYGAWFHHPRVIRFDHGFFAQVDTNGAMTVALEHINPITGSITESFRGSGTNGPRGAVRAYFRNGYMHGHVETNGVRASGVIVYWTPQGKVARRIKLELMEPLFPPLPPPLPPPVNSPVDPPPVIPPIPREAPGVRIEGQRRIL